MVFKALHGFSPKYIAELLIPYQNSRNLRSSNQMILHVPKTRLISKGDRAFSVAAPVYFVCVTVCNDAVSTLVNGSCFKCAIEIQFVLYLLYLDLQGFLLCLCFVGLPLWLRVEHVVRPKMGCKLSRLFILHVV